MEPFQSRKNIVEAKDTAFWLTTRQKLETQDWHSGCQGWVVVAPAIALQ